MRALCSRRGTDPGTAHLCSLRSQEHMERKEGEKLFVMTKDNITELSQANKDKFKDKNYVKVRRVLSV